VVHAFWATESGFLAALAGRLLRVPTLVSLAGGELVALPDIEYGDQRVAWERLKVRTSLRLASAVSAGSNQLLSLAAGQVPPRRLHRLPLGVDVGMFSPGPPLPEKPRLVHVGTLTRVKDQTTLLRAIKVVRESMPDASLAIAGDGPLRADLEQLACELGVHQAVTFRGAIDHGALPDTYRAARAFVLASRHEAQGMVAIEAAACGVPVVGTRVGVIPELADSADAVAPIGSHTALARAMLAVLSDTDGRAGATQKIARTEFSLEHCTARFRSLYASLVAA
jgi:glycosyltransferase involved in cell wall biosynthesis